MRPAQLLDRMRSGESLDRDEIVAVVEGTCSGEWSEAQVGAFLMAVAIRDLDLESSSALTEAMLHSGENWRLGDEFPQLVDKHSTGGVGDKTSLIVSPVLAACDVPVVMLTGRALGHTGGTADKLEMIPGVKLDVDRDRCVELIREHRMAIGVATEGIAPADRIFYRMRDQTGTVPSLALVTASILSKKLATGARGIVFDVKSGDGAIFPEFEVGRELAQRMVRVCGELGCSASAVLSDMSQPLGRWAGGACEVNESLDVLSGQGDDRLRELSLVLCEEAASRVGIELARPRLERALDDGSARDCFLRWAQAQGAEESWLDDPRLPLAAVEMPIVAERDGHLGAIHTRQIGWLLAEAANGPNGELRPGVGVEIEARVGDEVRAGDELARLYLVRDDADLGSRAEDCFEVVDAATAPQLVRERIS